MRACVRIVYLLPDCDDVTGAVGAVCWLGFANFDASLVLPMALLLVRAHVLFVAYLYTRMHVNLRTPAPIQTPVPALRSTTPSPPPPHSLPPPKKQHTHALFTHRPPSTPLQHPSHTHTPLHTQVSFSPASHVFVFVGAVVAERLLYLPSIGFCMLLAALGESWASGRLSNTARKVRVGIQAYKLCTASVHLPTLRIYVISYIMAISVLTLAVPNPATAGLQPLLVVAGIANQRQPTNHRPRRYPTRGTRGGPHRPPACPRGELGRSRRQLGGCR